MAQQLAGQRHFLGLVSEQSLYNLSARTIELEVIRALRHYGLGLIPWSPLAWGVLGGAFSGAGKGSRRSLGWNQPYVEEHRPQFVAYEAFCDALGEQPADVALAWLLHQPAVTAPIIGPTPGDPDKAHDRNEPPGRRRPRRAA
jgi:aryl-alcohol dehydrogenase-like predicted oxidoreductase